MSLAFLQILSIENDCHSACIAISTEKQRFLIEAGEGTQRLIVEHKVRLGKIASILLTSGQISSLGGLPGMMLTLDDAGVSPIQVVCPPEAQTYIQATQYFMRSLGSFNLITPQNTLQPIKYDELTITPVLVECASPLIQIESRICYIGETPSIAGKFDIQKAIELKIPKGPLYGKLKNGATVQLEDGRTISPDLVVGEATPPQYFAIICRIDEEKDLLNLVQNNIWTNYSQSEKKHFSVMVHLSPSTITSSSLYQNWLLTFPLETQHLFIGKQDSLNRSTSFLQSSLYNSKLFELFGGNFTRFAPFIASSTTSTASNNHHIGENLLKYNLLPIKKKGLIESPYQLLTQSVKEELVPFHKESFLTYPYLHKILEIKQNHYLTQINARPELDITEDYWLYFMGTGCAIPSRYRNVSSFLLYLSATDSCILLDCGEATWFQLTYLQPPFPTFQPALEGSNWERWASIIKMVWISHPHADHHLGLIHLILKRRQFLPASNFVPLLVIAPINVYSYLRDVSAIYPNLASSFVFIPCNYFDPTETCTSCVTLNNSLLTRPASVLASNTNSSTTPNTNLSKVESIEITEDSEDLKATKRARTMFLNYSTYYQQFLSSEHSESLSFLQKIFETIGIESLSNIPVIHCRQSYGLILTARIEREIINRPTKTLKLVYSGDTRPCDQLVLFGKDADILIHEATFEDDKYIEAVNKKHSTISEAMEVGRLMNCSSIILTHFSQRYHGVPLQFHPKGADPIELIQQKMKEQETQNQRILLPIIAFDFMIISHLDLSWLPYLTHPIAEIFAKDALTEEEELEKEAKG